MVRRGSSDGSKEPFRAWCGKVGELRTLLELGGHTYGCSDGNCYQLDAECSNPSTWCVEIVRSPDRFNIRLSTGRIGNDIYRVFAPLVRRLLNCERVLVYCKRIGHCADLFTLFHRELGARGYWPPGSPRRVENRLFAMYHSGSAEATKDFVLKSLLETDGVCRVVFATNALGTGVNMRVFYKVGLLTQLKNTRKNMVELAEMAKKQSFCGTGFFSSMLLWIFENTFVTVTCAEGISSCNYLVPSHVTFHYHTAAVTYVQRPVLAKRIHHAAIRT